MSAGAPPGHGHGPVAGDFGDEAVLAGFVERLYAHDPTLWSTDPAHHAVASRRLGWLDLPRTMAAHVEEIEAFVREVRHAGLTHVVLLGMGGSSLAPEVLRLVCGVAPGHLELTVLDDTAPAAVRAVTAAHDPRRTLVLVSSKSGGTIEVTSLEKHFHAWAREGLGGSPGLHFAAITDPGTTLERHGVSAGYRKVFTNPADVGGRYSALSLFGLVPAALIGVSVRQLLADAALEHAHSGPDGTLEASGADLGGALGHLARHGRDKLTLVPEPALAPLGSWLEQLVAESTGKDGRGIVPVDLEPPGAPEAYGNDRVFVRLQRGPLRDPLDAALEPLRAAGHPILVQSLEVMHGLAGAFLHWELATVAASAVLGVDPFDEPNVAEAKQATAEVLERRVAEGRFHDEHARAHHGGVAVFAPDATAEAIRPHLGHAHGPADWLRGLLALARPGDYVALLAWLPRAAALHPRLERLRAAVRDTTRAATTLGYGPRYLHSTGQLHKGGPDTGLFVQLLADDGADLPIPGERYGFAALHRAQADGDYQALARRGRRVLRVHLGRDPLGHLDALADALA